MNKNWADSAASYCARFNNFLGILLPLKHKEFANYKGHSQSVGKPYSDHVFFMPDSDSQTSKTPSTHFSLFLKVKGKYRNKKGRYSNLKKTGY